MVEQKPENPYAQTYANFLKNTADHRLTVVYDDGLYRHLRMHDPEMGGIWSWGIATWPGHLATFGDIASGFVFSRIEDMLAFFDRFGHHSYYSDGAPSIDFRYWAEKIIGADGHKRVRKYSHDTFLRQIVDVLEEDAALGIDAQTEYEKIIEVARRVAERNGVLYEDYLEGLQKNTSLALLDIDENSSDEQEFFGLPIPQISPAERRWELSEDAREVEENSEAAHQWLRDHDDVFGQDTWEWDLSDFDVHFVFTCYALDKTVQAWNEHLAMKSKAASVPKTSTRAAPITKQD